MEEKKERSAPYAELIVVWSVSRGLLRKFGEGASKRPFATTCAVSDTYLNLCEEGHCLGLSMAYQRLDLGV